MKKNGLTSTPVFEHPPAMQTTPSATSDQQKRTLTGNRLKSNVLSGLVMTGIVLWSGPTFAQDRPNAVHVEALGTGLMLSVHYERMLTDSFALRAGAGAFFAVVEAGTTFPLMATWLIGDGKNRLELGAGLVIVDLHSVFDDDEDDSLLGIEDDVVLGVGYLGYRFTGDCGLIFRIGFTPLVGDDGFKAYGGASMGYRF